MLLNIDVTIDNVPDIKETEVFIRLLNLFGKKYIYHNNKLKMYQSDIQSIEIPDDITQLVHGTIYLLPVLLFINHTINIFQTGGCKIGNENTVSSRPVEHMLSIMQKFGAIRVGDSLFLQDEYRAAEVNIKDYSNDKNVLSGPLVSGATKTAILCALKAEGITIIRKPYMKADVLEMLQFIELSGGKYELKEETLKIIPPKTKKRIHYQLTSDVSEIVTFIAFAQFHKTSVVLNNICNETIIKKSLVHELLYFGKIGVSIEWRKKSLRIMSASEPKAIGMINVNGETIYSDSQPFFLLSLLDAENESIIEDDVWNNRFEYAKELKHAGEPIEFINNKTVRILGQNENVIDTKKTLVAKDLRGAACLLIYASKHIGQKVKNVEHIERGYDDFWGKMKKLGIEFDVDERE